MLICRKAIREACSPLPTHTPPLTTAPLIRTLPVSDCLYYLCSPNKQKDPESSPVKCVQTLSCGCSQSTHTGLLKPAFYGTNKTETRTISHSTPLRWIPACTRTHSVPFSRRRSAVGTRPSKRQSGRSRVSPRGYAQSEARERGRLGKRGWGRVGCDLS